MPRRSADWIEEENKEEHAMNGANYWRNKYQNLSLLYRSLHTDFQTRTAQFQAYRWEAENQIDTLEDELRGMTHAFDSSQEELAKTILELQEAQSQVKHMAPYFIRRRETHYK